MHSIMSDKVVSPRTAFITSFVKEVLKGNASTARFVLRFMPLGMVSWKISLSFPYKSRSNNSSSGLVSLSAKTFEERWQFLTSALRVHISFR